MAIQGRGFLFRHRFTKPVPADAVAGGDGDPGVRISGSFLSKPAKIKITGTFAHKPVKVKVSGSFVQVQ